MKHELMAGKTDRTPSKATGRVIVITGASSGIGRATARAFASRGDRLVLAARNERSLQVVVEECAARGGAAIAVRTDVSDEEQVLALARAAVDAYGRIDAWVGAASVMSFGTFEQTPSAIFTQVIETNLMGQVHGARAALRQFRRQGAGTLVMVGSLYSEVGSPYISPYVTSKFATLGLAEVLRQELRRSRGIHVVAVLPASIDTPIYQHAANYTGRHVHPLVPISAPERVAKAIVRSIGHRRPVVVVGRSQRIATALHGITPGLYDRVTSLAQESLALRGRGAPRSSGTVLAPGTDDGGVTGGWRSTPLRVLGVGAVAGAGVLYLRRRIS